jgi:zinc protease
MPLNLFPRRVPGCIRGFAPAALLAMLAWFLPGSVSLAMPPTVGRLENGLTYYILPNHWPADRVSLRLAVRAGSVMEDDDQRGLAHVLEHMAFQGTTNFPKDLIPYMERHGAALGPDVNAYTSFDRTVYQLDLPSAPDSVVNVGLRLLADFASEALLDEAALEKERGVVIEEWRQGKTSGSRLFDVHRSALYAGSRRAERQPIGDPDIIRTAPVSRLRDFYRDWYRPDRMAVIVVGAVSVARMDEAIRQHFGDWHVSTPPRPEPYHSIPPHDETLISLASDPEMWQPVIEVGFRRYADAAQDPGPVGDMVIDEFLEASLLRTLKAGDIQTVSVFRRMLGPGTQLLTVRCGVKPRGAIAGLSALLLEFERLSQHEVSAEVLEESRDKVRAALRIRYENRTVLPNDDLAEDCLSHFFDGGELPDIESTYANLDTLLSRVTTETLSDLLDRLILVRDRLVLISTPKAEDLPTEDEVGKLLGEIGSTQTEKHENRRTDHRLMAYTPKAGTITGRRRIEDIDVTVLTLSNGAEVWLKPLADGPDYIEFEACAPGGVSLADPKDLASAAVSHTIASMIGCGGFQRRGLERSLGDRSVRGTVYILRDRHGLVGSTTPRDIEAAFQLIHGTLREMPSTDYVLNREAYLYVREHYRRALATRSPEALLGNEAKKVSTDGHRLMSHLSEKQLQKLSSTAAVQFYRRCFSNAADFRFALTGALTEEEVTPLIERYLASIPSVGKRQLAFDDRDLRFTQKPRVTTIEAGSDDKGFVALTFPTPGLADRTLQVRNQFTRTVLEIGLRDVLREERGDIYSLGVDKTSMAPLSDFGMTTIQFGCAPERADSLAAVALEVIGRLRTAGPDSALMERARATEKADWEERVRTNAYWNGLLVGMSLGGPEEWSDPRDVVDSLTPEMVQEELVRYFPADRYTQVIVKPAVRKK